MQKRFIILSLLFCAYLHVSAQKVGLVLSGGGARGLAHIGVIKALEENNIPIDFIAGSSAGAIIGSMYAQGFSPRQMDSIVRSDQFYNWATGVIDEEYNYYFRKKEDNASWITLKFSLDSVIQTSLPTNIVSSVPVDFALMENATPFIAKAKYNFDSLFVPFRCVASDVTNKKTVVFRNGDLAQAVRASASYPFYFKPVIVDGKFLYDGGMYNNFPADIMLSEFQPDIIIGVNASGTDFPTTENNIVSQIRTMMTTPTNFSVLCENGILINVNTDNYGLLDFSNIPELVNEGYKEAQNRMPDISQNIQRRTLASDLAKRRKEFMSDLPKLIVTDVTIEGINEKQASYVRSIVKRTNEPVALNELKTRYFQIVADENVKSISPSLKYRPDSTFDMHLRISQEKDLITQFGGVISSRPVSEVFAGVQYNVWRKRSYSFNGNFYFGRLYTSGQLKIRMNTPSSFPYFLEVEGTMNQYDFFKSSNSFFTDQKPSYIVKSDDNFGLNAGIPARSKGKLVAGGSYIRLKDSYYQSLDFTPQDTADQTIFRGGSGYLMFERNTLNRKLFANQGTFLNLKVRYVNGIEYNYPGSTSVDTLSSKNQRDWFQFKLVYDNYYKRRGHLKLGFYGEVSVTDAPFFTNYTSTVLAAPSFQPVSEMTTLFLPDFHAHNYIGAGTKNVIMLRNNLDWRIEGYVFQPYKQLLRTPDSKTVYSDAWLKPFFIGSSGVVFHTPLGPAALFVNYYHERKNPFSALFTFGYLIFNKSALD